MTPLKHIAQIPSYLPYRLQHRVINDWLRKQFAQAMDNGNLEFMRGRFLTIKIDEIGFELCLTLGKKSPVVIAGDIQEDAIISGDLDSFLLLAEQTIDPDMLFFQRKLSIEGDTEFALEVKNLLYRVEWRPEWKRLAQGIRRIKQAFGRLSPPTPSLPDQTKNR